MFFEQVLLTFSLKVLRFGPDSHWIHQACPNFPLVRTRLPLDSPSPSELASGSDSFPFGFIKPVRCCLRFGLVSLWIHQACPNVASSDVRISNLSVAHSDRFHSPNLSELAFGSDSISIGFIKPVRCCLRFGLVSLWIHQTCPMLPQVRTRFPLDSSNLSDVASGSDSFPFGFIKPVRYCLRFGLNFHWIHQACPKSPLVRTRFPLGSLNLSDVALCSDSLPPGFTKPVQNHF